MDYQLLVTSSRLALLSASMCLAYLIPMPILNTGSKLRLVIWFLLSVLLWTIGAAYYLWSDKKEKQGEILNLFNFRKYKLEPIIFGLTVAVVLFYLLR